MIYFRGRFQRPAISNRLGGLLLNFKATIKILAVSGVSIFSACKSGGNGGSEVASASKPNSEKVSLVCIRDGGSSELPTVAVRDNLVFLVTDPDEDASGDLKLLQSFEVKVDAKGDKASPDKEKVTYSKESAKFEMKTEPGVSQDRPTIFAEVSYNGRRWDAYCQTNIKSISFTKP